MHIKSAVFQISAPKLAACPVSRLREFAFIGRSNVGKSSLLNMLAGGKELARVSATPGHTQLINFFTINGAWTLVDLPGYGYAKASKAARAGFQAMILEYLSGRPNLARVFVLIDSMLPPQEIDIEFVQWLLETSVPFELVFTKTDRMKPAKVQVNIALFQKRLEEWGHTASKTFITSAKTKSGRNELLAVISRALAEPAESLTSEGPTE